MTPTQCKTMNHRSQLLIHLKISAGTPTADTKLTSLLFIIQRKANSVLATNILQIGTNKA